MNLFVGTSGYSYKQWKGNFYPDDLSDKKMLQYYAGQFNAVEINNTFYRMPKRSVLENWKKEVPPGFRFVIKAPKQLTHIKKLETGDSSEYFISTASSLEEQLGVVLFQLPPYFRKDAGRLENFTSSIKGSLKAAFEFRHDSWFEEDIYEILRKKNYAICLSDTDEKPLTEIISTADWAYLRLRKTDYNIASLKKWKKHIEKQKWNEAYIFFKHEDEGKGPEYARKFNSAPALRN